MMCEKESEEIMQELRTVDLQSVKKTEGIKIGDIVSWAYELPGDPQYGTIYMVVGINSEAKDIYVTCILNRPYEFREFHVSQLKRL